MDPRGRCRKVRSSEKATATKPVPSPQRAMATKDAATADDAATAYVARMELRCLSANSLAA